MYENMNFSLSKGRFIGNMKFINLPSPLFVKEGIKLYTSPFEKGRLRGICRSRIQNKSYIRE